MELKSDDLKKMADMNAAELKKYVDDLYLKERGPIIFGYARVSTKGQERDGFSLEDQEKDLRNAGATVIYKEAYTGKVVDRPEFDKLLKEVRENDTLVVTKLDRIARTAADGEKIVEDLLAKGVTVRILNMGTLDDSPMGKIIRQIFFAFAEFERDLILERTQRGREIARQKPGYREGRPHKYSKEQIAHALNLLNDHSYSEVQKMTGISRSTLIREHQKIGGRKAV
jgi:DNA invertase Pin-like site-specific DNA recombinase